MHDSENYDVAEMSEMLADFTHRIDYLFVKGSAIGPWQGRMRRGREGEGGGGEGGGEGGRGTKERRRRRRRRSQGGEGGGCASRLSLIHI
eukprot:3775810-Pyramimonas_sp.AAC.1